MPTAAATLRADKFLHHVRVFKTRSLASQACTKGNVKIGGSAVKPSREVRAGDVIEICRGDLHLTLRVTAVPANRVGAPLVAHYCENLTPAAAYERAAEARRQRELIRPATPHETASRPNKKQMRELREWMGID